MPVTIATVGDLSGHLTRTVEEGHHLLAVDQELDCHREGTYLAGGKLE
jgi:hypothetical protein